MLTLSCSLIIFSSCPLIYLDHYLDPKFLNLMAAALTNCPSSSRCRYDVFLSFRGETRKNFTDHLYNALVREGFHTFRDDNEIERGENIGSEIEEALRVSSMSIIILSEDFASSTWCLDELAMIIELRRTGGHVVMPVFYKVDPSQLRKLTGSYREAFSRHEERFKNETDMVERWKAALQEVATLGGMRLGDGYEAQLVEDIVNQVEQKIGGRKPLHVSSSLVGADSYIESINLWFEHDPDDVGAAIIFGIGGVGKTTIAMTIYNQNYAKFEASSFLADVREATQQPNGLVRLQWQLLSDIKKKEEKWINSPAEGAARIKRAVKDRRVLIVLDDVDELDDFEAIIGMKGWLHHGSKIIVTTRNESLLSASEPSVKFRIEPLNYKDSLELFSWHAFGQATPSEGYSDNFESVMNYCDGLPLALKVLGRLLRGRSEEEWESELEEMKAIPDEKIQKVLKTGYNSLKDHYKDLFLDIACFFVGEDRDYVAMILGGLGFEATNGIRHLVKRCLLEIKVDNKVTMHNLIRDMGREIVRQESPENPGKRSRVWRDKDAFNVLRDITGTGKVRGLCFNMLMSKEGNSSSGNRKRLRDEGIFETHAFTKMHGLKLLKLNYVQLDGNYTNFPKGIIWLSWRGFSLKHIPDGLRLEELVVLDMRNSHLKRVWKGTKVLSELKILNLSHSHDLAETPDFSGLPRLERLLLQDCVKLIEIHESICELNSLEVLNLRGCSCLKRLPLRVHTLTSIKELVLSGCSSLGKQPEELGKLWSSRSTNESTFAVDQEHFGWNSRFSKCISSVGQKIFPSLFLPKGGSLSLPNFLVSLDLARCNLTDNDIPHLDCLHSLKTLDLSGNPIYCLPESIKNITTLQDLYLFRCRKIKSLFDLPKSLANLEIGSCSSLERIGNLTRLVKLGAQASQLSWLHGTDSKGEMLSLAALNCVKLVEIEGTCRLEPPGLPNDLSLLDIQTYYKEDCRLESFEVEMSFLFSSTVRKTTLQVWHHNNVASIYYPSNMVSRFPWNRNNQWLCKVLPDAKQTECKMSISVPSILGQKINGLLFNLLFSSDLSTFNWVDHISPHFSVTMVDKIMGLKWSHELTAYGIPKAGNDVVWTSHWLLGDNVLKVDELLEISITVPSVFYIKECYIEPVYETEGMAVRFYGEAIGGTIPPHLSLFRKLVHRKWSFKEGGVPQKLVSLRQTAELIDDVLGRSPEFAGLLNFLVPKQRHPEEVKEETEVLVKMVAAVTACICKRIAEN